MPTLLHLFAERSATRSVKNLWKTALLIGAPNLCTITIALIYKQNMQTFKLNYKYLTVTVEGWNFCQTGPTHTSG